MDHVRPGFRFVAAKDLDGSGKKLGGVPVKGIDGEQLGEVEGFILDIFEGRPRHVVVSAGWFIHKRFLLPIGHVGFAAGDDALVADITKDRVERFPGFDKSEFEKLSSEDLKQLDALMAGACAGEALTPGEIARHYETPAWWDPSFYKVPASDRR
jgi:hypothetical protein